MNRKNMNRIAIFAVTVMSLAWTLSAHSPAETNDLVRGMLGSIVFAANDNLLDGRPWIGNREAPVTWPGFLGRDESHGWTLAEKKAAFAWYLSTLGTNDCRSLSSLDKQCVRVALNQCRTLNYTEAASSLKALALNPKGICRDDAIELAIKYGRVDDYMTTFVETIITNTLVYTRPERGMACGAYSEKLISAAPTNEIDIAQCHRAVMMLYHHRQCGLAGVNMLDNLFSTRIDSYEMSSNRLAFASFVLNHPDARDFNIRKFTSVTNQLLSSGQPLVQLNIGEGE